MHAPQHQQWWEIQVSSSSWDTWRKDFTPTDDIPTSLWFCCWSTGHYGVGLLTWQKEVLASMKIELHPPLVGGGPLVLSLPFAPLLVLCLSGIYSPPGSSLWWNNPTPRWFSYSSRETDQRFSLAHDPTWLISLSFPGGHRNYLRNARKYELTWWNSVLEFVEVKRQSEFFSTVSLRDHFHTIKCTHYTFYGIEIHNFYNHDFYNLWFLINLSN